MCCLAPRSTPHRLICGGYHSTDMRLAKVRQGQFDTPKSWSWISFSGDWTHCSCFWSGCAGVGSILKHKSYRLLIFTTSVEFLNSVNLVHEVTRELHRWWAMMDECYPIVLIFIILLWKVNKQYYFTAKCHSFAQVLYNKSARCTPWATLSTICEVTKQARGCPSLYFSLLICFPVNYNLGFVIVTVEGCLFVAIYSVSGAGGRLR